MPPTGLPNRRMRFGPIRFWIMADHLRSPTVSAAAVVITDPGHQDDDVGHGLAIGGQEAEPGGAEVAGPADQEVNDARRSTSTTGTDRAKTTMPTKRFTLASCLARQ